MTLCKFKVDASVSEQHAALFFKAEVSRMKVLLGSCMKASHTNWGEGGSWSSIQTNRESVQGILEKWPFHFQWYIYKLVII
jgi:hypothetical protein